MFQRSITINNDQERSRTIRNGQERLGTIRNGQERFGTVKNGQERWERLRTLWNGTVLLGEWYGNGNASSSEELL